VGFRKAYQKAANWLRKAPWSSLFLGLPVESEPFVKAYAEQKVDEKEFWSNITLLTGHGKPFINSSATGLRTEYLENVLFVPLKGIRRLNPDELITMIAKELRRQPKTGYGANLKIESLRAA
jgi:succinyl-CoA synthetase beta subunit